MQSLNNTKYILTCQEISDIRSSGGPTTKDFIMKTLAKWSLYLRDLTMLCADTSSKSVWNWYITIKTNYDFMLDPSGDTFIADLMKLSLSHNIIMLRQRKDDFYSEFKVYLEESKDGTTNIDADMIDAIVGKVAE